MTVTQVQKIIGQYMQNSGRGGFITGTVESVSPLSVKAGKLELGEESLYITDNCIGLIMNLKHDHDDGSPELKDGVVLRDELKPGDGVLLLCRPDKVDGVKYILLDRIQKYKPVREVDAL